MDFVGFVPKSVLRELRFFSQRDFRLSLSLLFFYERIYNSCQFDFFVLWEKVDLAILSLNSLLLKGTQFSFFSEVWNRIFVLSNFLFYLKWRFFFFSMYFSSKQKFLWCLWFFKFFFFLKHVKFLYILRKLRIFEQFFIEFIAQSNFQQIRDVYNLLIWDFSLNFHVNFCSNFDTKVSFISIYYIKFWWILISNLFKKKIVS